MFVRHQILSILLLVAEVSVAHAAPDEAAAWSPPALVRAPPPAPPAPPVDPTGAVAAPTTAAAGSDPHAAGPVRRARTSRKTTRKRADRCTPPSPPTIDPRLTEARTQRQQILAAAQPMAASAGPGSMARMLGEAARDHGDPILFLAAAEAELDDPTVDQERLEAAIQLAQEAQRLIIAPRDLRIAAEEGPRLSADAKTLVGHITARQTQLRQERRGKAELACGAGFLVLSVTGIGMVVSGAVLRSRVEHARDAFAGEDAAYIAALDRTGDRADTVLAAGAVAGLVGAAIGIPLTIAGSRDLRRARNGPFERPSFRFQPGLAAFSIVGKF